MHSDAFRKKHTEALRAFSYSATVYPPKCSKKVRAKLTVHFSHMNCNGDSGKYLWIWAVVLAFMLIVMPHFTRTGGSKCPTLVYVYSFSYSCFLHALHFTDA